MTCNFKDPLIYPFINFSYLSKIIFLSTFLNYITRHMCPRNQLNLQMTTAILTYYITISNSNWPWAMSRCIYIIMELKVQKFQSCICNWKSNQEILLINKSIKDYSYFWIIDFDYWKITSQEIPGAWLW